MVALSTTAVMVIVVKMLTGLAFLPLLVLTLMFVPFAVALVLRLQSVRRH